MSLASRGWVFAGFLGCAAACSSSGMVLETRHGSPAPPDDAGAARTNDDAGAVHTNDDAGPLGRVDSGATPMGSRIHVRAYASDGEVLSIIGPHDSFWDVDCTIAVAEDGMSRCLPPVSYGIYYLDANCTQPIIYVNNAAPSGCGAPLQAPETFISYQFANPCPKPAVHVVKSGAEVTPPLQLYTFNLTTCQATAALSDGHFYAATPSPPTDWVAFDRSVRTVTSSLGVVQWNGADGSRLDGDMVLLPKDAPCEPGGPAGYSLADPAAVNHCIPTNRVYPAEGALYSDAACNSADVVAIAPACTSPDLLVLSGQGSPCGEESYSYFAVGDVVPNSRVTTDLLGPCRPAEGILGGFTSYAKGSPVDATTFPALQLLPEGMGRVQRLMWKSEGTTVGFPAGGAWRDAATGAPSSPMTFQDGVTRAVFSETFFNDPFYADAACTKPVVSSGSTPMTATNPPASASCGDASPSRWLLFTQQDPLSQLCPSSNMEPQVRPVGSAHAGKVYTTIADYNVKGTTACSEFVPSKSALSYDFYDTGDPVPASSVFATIDAIDL